MRGDRWILPAMVKVILGNLLPVGIGKDFIIVADLITVSGKHFRNIGARTVVNVIHFIPQIVGKGVRPLSRVVFRIRPGFHGYGTVNQVAQAAVVITVADNRGIHRLHDRAAATRRLQFWRR